MVARGWGYALIKAIEADDVQTVRQALSMAGVALDEQLCSSPHQCSWVRWMDSVWTRQTLFDILKLKEGDTALHFALRTRCYEAARELLSRGARPDLPNAQDTSALAMAPKFWQRERESALEGKRRSDQHFEDDFQETKVKTMESKTVRAAVDVRKNDWDKLSCQSRQARRDEHERRTVQSREEERRERYLKRLEESPRTVQQWAELGGKPTPHSLSREQQLQTTFDEMDLDSSGYIESSEMSELAQMRRDLYPMRADQKWTGELNRALLRKVDTDGNGKIDKREFVAHYLELFEDQDDCHFNTWVKQFRFVVQKLHGYTPNSPQPWRNSRTERYIESPHIESPRDQLADRLAESGFSRGEWESSPMEQSIASTALWGGSSSRSPRRSWVSTTVAQSPSWGAGSTLKLADSSDGFTDSISATPPISPLAQTGYIDPVEFWNFSSDSPRPPGAPRSPLGPQTPRAKMRSPLSVSVLMESRPNSRPASPPRQLTLRTRSGNDTSQMRPTKPTSPKGPADSKMHSWRAEQQKRQAEEQKREDSVKKMQGAQERQKVLQKQLVSELKIVKSGQSAQRRREAKLWAEWKTISESDTSTTEKEKNKCKWDLAIH